MDSYKNRGYILLKNFVPLNILAEFDRVANIGLNAPQEDQYYLRYKTNNKVSRIEKFVELSQDIHKWLQDIIPILNKYLPGKLTLYKDKLNYKYPGSISFPAHQDLADRWKRVEYINLGVAIDKTTEENGALQFSDTNYKSLTYRPGTKFNSDLVKKWNLILMERGDVVLFTATIPHRSGPNITEGFRKMAFITFGKNLDAKDRLKFYRMRILNQPPCDANLKKQWKL